VAITLCGANVSHLADSVDYLLGTGVREIAISPNLMPEPAWTDSDSDDLDREIARVHRLCLDHYHNTGQVPVALFRKVGRERALTSDDDLMCRVGNGESLVIDATGELYPCVLFAETYRGAAKPALDATARRLSLGRAGDSQLFRRLAALPRIVRSSPLLAGRTRKHSARGRCIDCRYWGRCAVCPVSIALAQEGLDPNRVPDFQCAFNRISLKYRDRFPRQPDVGEVLARLRRTVARPAPAPRPTSSRRRTPPSAPGLRA
jgi:MoaA/NifB/PqqE/SkfB family radical SAM enzyme